MPDIPRKLLRQFLGQASLQCNYVLLAGLDIADALDANDRHRVFYGVQNLLVAAANVSKVLWGGGGSRLAERKQLRDIIAVSDDSPIRKTGMRNNYEHFDERLERWWRDSKDHNIIDITTFSRDHVRGTDPLDWFRVFDPASGDVLFFSEDFNIHEILDEADQLIPRLNQACQDYDR